MRSYSEFQTNFEKHLDELAKLVSVNGGLEKKLAFNDFFDFLMEYKSEMGYYRPELKKIMELRLLMLIDSDYHFGAYHYLRNLCDIEFKSYYDENTDECVEYFYSTSGELHRV